MSTVENFIHYVIASKEDQLLAANPQDANRIRAEMNLAYQLLSGSERKAP